MTKAIDAGIPKMRIEKAAAKKQARIDGDMDIIVGVNKYRSGEEDGLQILEIDNAAVKRQQLERLKMIRHKRNDQRVEQALKDLTAAAKLKMGASNIETNAEPYQ